MKREFETIIRLLAGRKTLLLAAVLLTIAEIAMGLALPYLAGKQIEALESRPGLMGGFFRGPTAVFAAATLAMLAVHVIRQVAAGAGSVLEVHTRENLAMDTDRLMFEKMEGMDAGFFRNLKNRRLLYVLFDIGNLAHSFLSFSRSSLKTGISVAAIMPIIFAVDPRVFGVAAAAGALQLAALRAGVRRENAYRIHKNRRLARVNELKFLFRYHYHDLISASGQDRIMPEYWERAREQVSLETAHQRISFRYRVITASIEYLSAAAVAGIAGREVLSGNMSIGTFTMLTMYALQLETGIGGIVQNAGEWLRMKAVILQMGFFLSLRPRLDLSSSGRPERAPSGPVEVRGVRFRFPSLADEEREYLAFLIDRLKIDATRSRHYIQEETLVHEWQDLLLESSRPRPVVLDGADCTFRQGDITALIGRNGAGKTTLMNLLLRSYDCDEGTITAGGVPVRDLAPDYARRLFAMVTQSPFIMESFSIRDNILLGAPEGVPDGAIWELLDRVGLGDDFRALPRGLDSLIGDEVNFSGGQLQLIAVVRAVIQDRPYIVLDEGTNQLDAEREIVILDVLGELKRDRAVIVITHRMTTARKADAIHVMDRGRIVESGTHAGLLAIEGGLYRRFWEIQVVE